MTILLPPEGFFITTCQITYLIFVTLLVGVDPIGETYGAYEEWLLHYPSRDRVQDWQGIQGISKL